MSNAKSGFQQFPSTPPVPSVSPLGRNARSSSSHLPKPSTAWATAIYHLNELLPACFGFISRGENQASLKNGSNEVSADDDTP